MVALARNQVNTSALLNWFIRVNGVLTDAFDIGFRIIDISAGNGLPGTQVFPAAVGTYEDVTSSGNFGTGSYYAYDNGAAAGWQVPIAQPLGTHRIEWRWQISAAAQVQTGSEEFEILPESVGSTDDTYVSLADIRALGITGDATTATTDADILAAIAVCQAALDRATRQWFGPRLLDFYFDGTDSDAIHLGVPIISIELLRINDSETDLSTSLYRVYSGQNAVEDSRRNPRIKLINNRDTRDIYTSPIGHGRLVFAKGRQNQRVRGMFGFVEDDMQAPPLIKEALKRMVVTKLSNPIVGTTTVTPPSSGPPGVIIEEQTDDHRVKYAVAAVAERKSGVSGLTADAFVQDVIKMYKAPIGIATPAGWTAQVR